MCDRVRHVRCYSGSPSQGGGPGRSLSSAVFPEPPSSRGFRFLFSGYRTASRAVLHPKFLPPFLQSLKSPWCRPLHLSVSFLLKITTFSAVLDNSRRVQHRTTTKTPKTRNTPRSELVLFAFFSIRKFLGD